MTTLTRRAFGALVASATMFAGPVFAQQGEIKIGYNADQSASGAAELGLSGRYGFEAAIEDLNAKGGILGKKVVAVIRDDAARRRNRSRT
jgi:branched-chain amino acid transport system substrate-binding protein